MRQYSFILSFCAIMLVGLPSTLARGFVAMEPSHIDALMPMIVSVMEGKKVHVNESLLPSEPFLASSYSPKSGELKSAYTYNSGRSRYDYHGFSEAPKGSIAIIPIQGSLTRNDYCGWFGTMSLAKVVADAEASANIEGILLDVRSPGGETYGSQTLSQSVAQAANIKPIVSHIEEGYAASAAYWAISHSSKIYLAKEGDQLGSIGTYVTIIDSKGALDKKGYKAYVIYSPTSQQKNAEVRQLLESKGENVSLFEEKLAYVDGLFMADVKNGRGNKLNAEALQGAMYFANDAIKMGLADGIASRTEALQEIMNLSGSSQTFS